MTAILALAILASCDAYPALRERDAAPDARQAIASGDCRLIGVFGFTTETPGAPYEEKVRRGARMIEGTSDTPATGAEVRFNNRARIYAERYNQEILAHCP